MNLTDPRIIIFLLSVLAGFLVNLNSITAQVRFLETHSAQLMSSIGAVSALLFCLIMKKLLNPSFIKIKYSKFMSIVAALLATGLLTSGITSSPIAWIFMALFMSECIRIMLIELSNRHVNPARLGAFYYSLIQGFEIGTLTAVALILITDIEYTHPLYFFSGVCMLLLLFASITWIYFGNRKKIEIKFSSKALNQLDLVPYSQTLFVSLLIMGSCMGLFRQFQDFQVRNFIKLTETSPTGLMESILKVYFLGSVLTLIVSFCLSKLTTLKRFSPLKSIAIGAALIILVQITIHSSETLKGVLALGSVTRGLERGLYMPSVVLLLSFFVGPQRAVLRFWHHLMVLFVPSAAFIIFNFIPTFAEQKILERITPSIILISLCGVAFLALYSQRFFIDFFKRNLSSSKIPAILGATGLSFLRSKDFADSMELVLDSNPKKLLKKMVILGLGFSEDPKSQILIKKEFESEKEEIQLAVIDALSTSRSYEGMKFILNVCLTGRGAHSLAVRLNAASMIATLYGKKAIPIIMVGLDDEDPRQIANAIEALALFKDKTLADIFRKFSTSTTPRVKANALMGLGMIPSTKKEALSEIRAALKKEPSLEMSSYLYVVGQIKEFSFLSDLLDLEKKTRNQTGETIHSVRRMLAWVLSRMNKNLGKELFLEQLETVAKNKQNPDSVLHFFAQFEQDERLDCVQFWINQSSDDSVRKYRHQLLSNLFHQSRFDFHLESDFANEMIESV